MKRTIILSAVIFAALSVMAQSDDDVYFVPKKQTARPVQTETYYVGSDRDVDEYNRHGSFRSSVTELDSDDSFAFDEVPGEYPDSLATDSLLINEPFYDGPDDDDFTYSRELDRWYGDDRPCVDDPDEWYYCRRLYGYPYYGWWSGWYSPLYYSALWGWYDPWYYGWWGGWYGWYYPSYWWGGWHGGGHHGWLASGGHGFGYSNRGHGHIASSGAGAGVSGRRSSRNVYNDIARRSNARGVSSAGRTGSSRTTGTRTTGTRTRTTTRSYAPSSTSSRSFGGSFGGGSRGGFGGGGFHGGGGHGGRR